MSEPSLYADTNTISVQFYRGANPATIAWRDTTLLWWKWESKWFRVFASRVTDVELSRGQYSGKQSAISFVRRLPYLMRTKDVGTLAERYLFERLVPENKPVDAIQLAMATVHKIDYLLTWNYAHMANVGSQRRLQLINKRLRLRTPLPVSPDTIPKVALGQAIRRND